MSACEGRNMTRLFSVIRTTCHPLSARLDILSCDIGRVSSAKLVGTCDCLALCSYTLSFQLTFSFKLDHPSSLDALYWYELWKPLVSAERSSSLHAHRTIYNTWKIMILMLPLHYILKIKLNLVSSIMQASILQLPGFYFLWWWMTVKLIFLYLILYLLLW